MLHANLPPHVPIIVMDCPVTRRYLQPLLDSGVVPPGRVRFQPLKADGTVVRAGAVYTLLNSHFSNVFNGDVGSPPRADRHTPHRAEATPGRAGATPPGADRRARTICIRPPPAPHLHPPARVPRPGATPLRYRVLRAAYSPGGPVPSPRRTTIVLIDRGRGKSRSFSNVEAVEAAIGRAVGRHEGGSGGGGGGRGVGALRVVRWRPNLRNVTDDVEAFRHAALIVAPHGAGLSNMLFAAEGTPVIEVCYDDLGNKASKSMFCPAMYAAMAANLHNPYWVVTGAGTYTSPMRVDLAQLDAALQQALAALAALRHRGAGAAKRAAQPPGEERSAASLVQRLRRHSCLPPPGA